MKSCSRRLRRDESGSVLVVAFVFMGILTVWSTANLQRGMVEIRSANRYIEKLQAGQLAETALDQAILQVATSDTSAIALTSLSSFGSYGAAISDNGADYTITATGVNNMVTQQLEAVVRFNPDTLFDHAVFADTGMTVRGTTDSYDSCKGAYADQTPGANGDLGTNGTESKSIDLKNTSEVNGDLYVGEGMESPEDAVSGSTYTGTVSSQPTNTELVGVTAPDGVTCTTVSVANSDTYTLYEAFSPYCFNTLEVKNSASLAVSGNVVVYAGDLDLKNSANINISGSPSQLAFLITSDTQVKIRNSGDFVATVYAPDADIDIDNSAQVFGAVTGSSVDLKNGSSIHYDDCLEGFDPVGLANPAEVLSWRDI